LEPDRFPDQKVERDSERELQFVRRKTGKILKKINHRISQRENIRRFRIRINYAKPHNFL